MITEALLALTLSAQATPPVVKNPRLVEFECPDHDRVNAHELDIISVASGQVVQTLQLGAPPQDPDGKVRITINVQPVAFGDYIVKVRAVAGQHKSEDSEASNPWQRVPGAPAKPDVR